MSNTNVPAKLGSPAFNGVNARNLLNKVTGRSDIFFALGIVGIIMVLLVPVPSMFLDLLLGISITLSVLILMTVLFVEKPLGLSAFPTILLIATMLRLSLNIASTRLILGEGHTGTDAAGQVIEAFGHFVMSGQIAIGVIIFGILTIINFVVITKGSGRIAEVSARFSLDAMPGKQMAIDADLSAGLIDETEAKTRRRELEDESTFFGAMDGASKFVRGDAVAGLMITFINLLGGVIIGVVSRDLSFSDAIQTYTLLTIGDGLVSQIPALIVSTAAGMLVTKAGVVGSSEKAVLGQLNEFPSALGLTAFLALMLAFMPGMPAAPFIALACIMGGMAAVQFRAQKHVREAVGKDGASLPRTASGQPVSAAHKDGDAEASPENEMNDILQIDSLRLELGYGLLPLINYQKGHRLTEQIKALRKQVARDLGFVMPAVRIQDNMQLPANQYVIKVKELESANGGIRPDMLMVMDPAGNKISLPGEDTTEPTFNLPAKWITDQHREEALFRNLTVVDPPTVITTHLTEVIKQHLSELLSYAETQKLLDDLGRDQQKLIAETIPSQISVSGVQRVLQLLLAELVSIRDLPTIMEAIADASHHTQNPTIITEHVRHRLARQICFSVTNHEGVIPVLSLSPHWEQIFVESISGKGEDKMLNMAPSRIQEFVTGIGNKYEQHMMSGGDTPVLLTSSVIRPYVRSIMERFRSGIIVMSQNEIHPRVKIKTLGQL